MKRFSDFAKDSNVMIGDKMKIEDVLGKEIEVIGCKINDSKQKSGTKVLTLQFRWDGVERILFTGSSVLIEQSEQYKDEMPFLAKIEKVNKFYTFT
ncbi:hypothetical protein GCM10008986_16860 [Salinibacillus aidingensis]|uniref:Uncharacterized protein n=1 Tax=Salinibacillus aidingensis TaxID=237684 RepID=A0ABP3L5T1_9BACI